MKEIIRADDRDNDIMHSLPLIPLPDNVYLIGAGRWARVICLELLKFLPAERITVISPAHAHIFKQWAEERQLPIRINSDLPRQDTGMRVAIVANAARDHALTAERLMHQGISTLIEKPLACNRSDIERLIAISQQTNTFMAASHLFLFTAYISRMRRIIHAVPSFSRVNFTWEDMLAEHRYGELKQHDATLPIITDVFPHIYSILNFITPNSSVEYRGLTIERGADIRLSLSIGQAPCEVFLSRDSKQRGRYLSFETPIGPVISNFSNEPGTLICGTRHYQGDPQWHTRASPLVQQLRAFFSACVGGVADERLSFEIDHAASHISDAAIADYRRISGSN